MSVHAAHPTCGWFTHRVQFIITVIVTVLSIVATGYSAGEWAVQSGEMLSRVLR